jgi:hypothetical protein
MCVGQVNSPVTTDLQLAKEYFNRVPVNSDATLQLFADDAVIYEPFSVEDGLRGKEEIEHFLKVAGMANQGLQKKISFVARGKNRLEVLVQFTRGGTIKGRFQFRTEDVQTQTGFEKKIKELRIRFAQ